MNTDFPRGIIVKRKENAPDFVKASLSFKVDEFKQYLDAKSKNGWVNIDVLLSKKNTLYAKLNDWEPKGSSYTDEAPASPESDPPSDDLDQIPF